MLAFAVALGFAFPFAQIDAVVGRRGGHRLGVMDPLRMLGFVRGRQAIALSRELAPLGTQPAPAGHAIDHEQEPECARKAGDRAGDEHR